MQLNRLRKREKQRQDMCFTTIQSIILIYNDANREQSQIWSAMFVLEGTSEMKKHVCFVISKYA